MKMSYFPGGRPEDFGAPPCGGGGGGFMIAMSLQIEALAERMIELGMCRLEVYAVSRMI